MLELHFLFQFLLVHNMPVKIVDLKVANRENLKKVMCICVCINNRFEDIEVFKLGRYIWREGQSNLIFGLTEWPTDFWVNFKKSTFQNYLKKIIFAPM